MKLLRDLGAKISLFKLAEFKERMKVGFVTVLLEDLLMVNQPSLVDDMSELLFEMAEPDMADFFTALLPNIINGMNIGNAEKQSVLDSWDSREVDRMGFIDNATTFLSEFKYYSN